MSGAQTSGTNNSPILNSNSPQAPRIPDWFSMAISDYTEEVKRQKEIARTLVSGIDFLRFIGLLYGHVYLCDQLPLHWRLKPDQIHQLNFRPCDLYLPWGGVGN